MEERKVKREKRGRGQEGYVSILLCLYVADHSLVKLECFNRRDV